MSPQLIVTCEHGGNKIPAKYLPQFAGAREILQTHRGWDPGALPLARQFAKGLDAPLFFSTTSRLLVDLNRSLHHPRVFSQWSKTLDADERKLIVETWYRPHRTSVESEISGFVDQKRTVVHLSVHSFTPVLDGNVRRADIGFLYDPQRSLEADFCERWRNSLKSRHADLIALMNSPYRGTSDGFTTYLRTRFPAKRYAGIELEINQKLLDQPRWQRIQCDLVHSLRETIK